MEADWGKNEALLRAGDRLVWGKEQGRWTRVYLVFAGGPVGQRYWSVLHNPIFPAHTPPQRDPCYCASCELWNPNNGQAAPLGKMASWAVKRY